MLLTKDVEMKINVKNIGWYREKGYKCVQGDVLMIKVEDLSRGTHVKVKYNCNKCNEIFELSFSSFIFRHGISNKTYCNKCANEINLEEKHGKYQAKNGSKLCKKCNRLLPANTDYYFLKNTNVDGFVNACKECNGHDFTDKLTNIPKQGYKFCIKCGNELEINSKYFPKDHNCKDGYRNVCRECDGDYYRTEETHRPEPWSESDIELFKKVYNSYTGEELVEKFFANRTIRSLECQADVYNIGWKTDEAKLRSYRQQAIKLSNKMKGIKLSTEHRLNISKSKIEYYKTHHGTRLGSIASEETREKMSNMVKARGYWKGNKNPRFINPLNGSSNGNWKGGITGFYFELRSDTKDWQKDSMEFCNYKCIITGGDFDNVHHLYPFKSIVNETFINCNLDIRQKVLDYSDDEFKSLRNELNRLHKFYGYGVCVCKPIHQLFHNTYGYLNNTLDQFINFVNKLENHEFDYWLDDNNLKLNINNQVIDYIKSSLSKQWTA